MDCKEVEALDCKVVVEDGRGWQSKVCRQEGCWGCGFDNDNCTVLACCPPCCNSHSCKVSCTVHAPDSDTSQLPESSDRTKILAPAASEPS